MRKNYLSILALCSILFFSLASLGSSTVQAASVTPVLEDGSTTCVSLGYANGYTVNPATPGGYVVVPSYLAISLNSGEGFNFNWSATAGIDAVLVSNGDQTNVYAYNPETMGDSGLSAPLDAGGSQTSVSNMSFCYDFEVLVKKTATTDFKRTYNWTIDKSVTPATWNLFANDSGTSQYTVAVTKSGFTDSNWTVSGDILVRNPAPTPATITGVSDSISGFGAVSVNCPVSFPYELAGGTSLHCTYSSSLPDGSSRTNTATAATSGAIGGGSYSVPVTFGSPGTVVNGSVNVDDTNGSSWVFNDSGSVTYEKTFTCNADSGKFNNTATIRETGQKDSAEVNVNCYDLNVSKDASTTFNRTWNWSIDKTGDQSSLLLSSGQIFPVNYQVVVDAQSNDGDFAVSGNITINNPAPMAATLSSVSDTVFSGINAVVNCPALMVPAGGTLNCTYSAVLPDKAQRTNTATAVLDNFDYAWNNLSGVLSGTTNYSGSAEVLFGSTPSVELDECIDVVDTRLDPTSGTVTVPLGTVCASDAPKTFTYSVSFGQNPLADVVLDCGNYLHKNTASFVTNDLFIKDSDSWYLDLTVKCDFGCTLTPGYWKTHSVYGPAPYDDNWLNILPAAQDSPFFNSGQTYYQVLWTTPSGGNAYYILAHAYIAAELNVLNGANVPADVSAALNQAESWFSQIYMTPDYNFKSNKTVRAEFISLAGLLDDYNNGLVGPGHCSE